MDTTKFIVVEKEYRDTEERLLARLKELFNGEYATSVCANCGIYETDPEPTGQIVVFKKCRYCFEGEL